MDKAEEKTGVNHKLLLIANAKYNNYNELTSIENEIGRLSDTFLRLKYTITSIVNSTYNDLVTCVNTFLSSVKENDTVIVYYTGHGFHYNGHNFIICKDSSLIPDNAKDPTFFEDNYKVYDLQKFIDYSYPTENVLLVCNACRIMRKILSEPNISSNSGRIISQLYATSIDTAAFDNSFFYECFCESCIRFEHTLSEIYESINEGMQKRMARGQTQQPVFIQGSKSFYITDKMNAFVEHQTYKDIITIYTDYIKETEHLVINEVGNLYNDCHAYANISYPKDKLFGILTSFIRNANYGFLGVFRDIPFVKITVLEKWFCVKGRFGSYWFYNDELYDYVAIKTKIEDICEESRDMPGVRVISREVYYLHHDNVIISGLSKEEGESCFELLFKTSDLRNLSNYITEIKQLTNITASTIMISARNGTDMLGFLNAFLYNYVYESDKILHLHSKERLDASLNVEPIDISTLSDKRTKDYVLNNIKDKKYNRIVMSRSITIASTGQLDEAIGEVVKLANTLNIKIIFTTEIMPDYLEVSPYTKPVYPYVEFVIELDVRSSNNTYVSRIIKNGKS